MRLDFDKDHVDSVKASGVLWMPDTDNSAIKCNWICKSKPTKRNILSDISRLFDPLGLVNPVTASAKIIIQELWKEKKDTGMIKF